MSFAHHIAIQLIDHEIGPNDSFRSRHLKKQLVHPQDLIQQANQLRTAFKLPAGDYHNIFRTQPQQGVITTFNEQFLYLCEKELKKSLIQRNPKKALLLGSLLTFILASGLIAGIIFAIEALSSMSILPLMIQKIPLLAMLSGFGPVVGILALSAIAASLVLGVYFVSVFLIHKATKPASPRLLENALVDMQGKLTSTEQILEQMQQGPRNDTVPSETAYMRFLAANNVVARTASVAAVQSNPVLFISEGPRR